jgi:photosystem II stability/assembly factor-like uncharacterized protein
VKIVSKAKWIVCVGIAMPIVLMGCQKNAEVTPSPSAAATAPKQANQTPTPATNPTPAASIKKTSISMVNEQEGWALNPNPDPDQSITANAVLHTKNGGQTWEDVTPKDAISEAGAANHLAGWWFSGTWGWLVIGNKVFLTEDSGGHWTNNIIPGSASVKAQIDVIDHQNGWILSITGQGAGSREEGLLHTTDGAKTWKSVPLPSNDEGFHYDAIHFISEKTGFLSGLNGNRKGKALLEVSHDGGATWVLSPITLPSHLASSFGSSPPPQFFDDRNGIMQVLIQPEQKSLFFKTNDAGNSWQQEGDEQLLHTSTFASPLKGWGTDANGALFMTSDGGQHWSKVDGTPDFHSIQFISDSIGWGITSKGELLTTKNGGKNWTKTGS